MPKLYYTISSCGAANFISAFHAGVKMDCEQVDLSTHLTASGADFYAINKKGNVPTIVLDDGTVINENSVTQQFIADMATGSVKLAAPYGTSERYLLQTALSYIAGEFHGSVGPLLNSSLPPEIAAHYRAATEKKLQYINDHLLGTKKFIVGDYLTGADTYMYIVLSWFPKLKLDFSAYPNVAEYFNRIKTMPSVMAAHERMATNPSTTV